MLATCGALRFGIPRSDGERTGLPMQSMRFTSLDLRETSLGNKFLKALAALSSEASATYSTILTLYDKDSDYRVAMDVADGKAEVRGEWKAANSAWFMRALKKGDRVWNDPNYALEDFR